MAVWIMDSEIWKRRVGRVSKTININKKSPRIELDEVQYQPHLPSVPSQQLLLLADTPATQCCPVVLAGPTS